LQRRSGFGVAFFAGEFVGGAGVAQYLFAEREVIHGIDDGPSGAVLQEAIAGGPPFRAFSVDERSPLDDTTPVRQR
jgi:hypothetical protein